MRYYAGFDPGIKGAFAIFTECGEFEAVYDMPVFTDKKGKRHIDGPELYSILLHYKILHAYIESVSASPQMGVTSSFSFGRSLGIIQGVLSGSEISYTMIRPRRWKENFGLIKKEKDMARHLVINMMPRLSELLKRKKDIDRAEAVLIAMTGMGKMRKEEVTVL